MPCDEVGVQVRQEHVLDRQILLAGERDVPIDIALGIDHGRRTRLLVTDEVRRVARQPRQNWWKSTVVRGSESWTFETPDRRTCPYLGCGTIRMYGFGDFQPFG